jgi:WD40 repeat protein
VDLAFDPGGRYVATTGWDEELRLWDPVIPAVSEDTGGHDRFVWSADYSPDGRFIASVGNDRTVRIWDVETGRNVKVFRGHDDETTAVDISPDSRFVASGSSDNSVRIWNVETGAQEKILRGHTAIIYGVRFSPDGKTLASGSEDRTVRIWDVATGGEVATLGGDTEISGPVRFSPDGTLIAAGSRHGPVYLFPTDDRSSPAKLLGHTDWVMGVDFNPDGTLLASGSRDGTIRLWDVATRTLHSTIVHGKGVYGVELSGDGRRLAFASADHSGWIRDLGGDRAVELAGHLDEANVIHFSPDGLRAVTASDDSTVRLWDTRSGAPLWRTTVMLDDPPEIHTHAGWTALDASGGPAPLGAGSAWRRAIEDHARPSSAGAAGEVLCILGPGESLEVWDIDRDAQIVQQSIPGLRQVLALPAGCLALSGDVLSYIDRAGSRTELTRDVTAAARSGADVLVASGGDVVVLTPAGERREAHRVGAGATAVGRVAGRLVVGFYDGSFEVLRPETRGEGADALHFEDTPTSPVVAFAEGPMGIIVVGFANGVLGLWSTESGARLQDVRLHGPVRFIVVRGDRLHAASDLGQHVSIDLGLYSRDYCDLMREVWQVVPVVWVNGQPVARAPSDHRCAR